MSGRHIADHPAHLAALLDREIPPALAEGPVPLLPGAVGGPSAASSSQERTRGGDGRRSPRPHRPSPSGAAAHTPAPPRR
ncbi:hypothetical protein G3I34_26985 [Streptomyces sp. SID8014]|uniref:hypothetical protein n=1 Tax=Streptomyces sp. SID8014 TaxID=2706097 RepID=UPI0013B81E35|nr:hypothetical protein [Streptomyces sp. SID8014]NEC15854.1 hypothetical protein [Streptomyces sp. SID8014]